MNLVSKILTIELDFGIHYIEVLSDGTIKKNGKELLKADNGAGYLSVGIGPKLGKKGKKITARKYVHRLVAEAFIPNPDNLPQVNHKDFDKSNNAVENLEWVSKADNIQHSHDNGRMKARYSVGAVTVLTKEQVIECYARVKLGEGVNKVAVSMGKPRTTVSSLINKRSRADITDKLDTLSKEELENILKTVA